LNDISLCQRCFDALSRPCSIFCRVKCALAQILVDGVRSRGLASGSSLFNNRSFAKRNSQDRRPLIETPLNHLPSGPLNGSEGFTDSPLL
jgi:hypothetical protein